MGNPAFCEGLSLTLYSRPQVQVCEGGRVEIRAEGLGVALVRLWACLLSVRACRLLSTHDLKCRWVRGGVGGDEVRTWGLGPALARLWATLLSGGICRSLSTLDLKCR